MDQKFKDKYRVEGSIGQFNNWASIPWLKIALKDKKVHVNTQEGYYLVYLFDEQMNGVYLSLNQAWTYYKNKYEDNELANEKVLKVSTKLRDLVCPHPGQNYVANIDLKTGGEYGRGYENSHIIGKYYSANNIPNDSVLIKDLEEMMQIYNDLAAQMRNRSYKELNEVLLLNSDDFYIEAQDDEEEYQAASNKYDVTATVAEHEPEPRDKKHYNDVEFQNPVS